MTSTRAHLAGGDPGRQLGALRLEVAMQVRDHASSPRIRGTRNRSSSAAGAPASTSASGNEGTTSSGRNTLVSGRAWEVGGMSSAATSDTWATDSQDHVQLRRQVGQLVVGQLDPGQPGQVGHVLRGQGHGPPS